RADGEIDDGDAHVREVLGGEGLDVVVERDGLHPLGEGLAGGEGRREGHAMPFGKVRTGPGGMPLRLRRGLLCRERRRGAVTAVTVAPADRMTVAAAQEAGLMRRDRVSAGVAAALAALLPLFLSLAGCVGDSQQGQPGGGSIVGPVWAAEEIAGAPV